MGFSFDWFWIAIDEEVKGVAFYPLKLFETSITFFKEPEPVVPPLAIRTLFGTRLKSGEILIDD